MNSQTLTSNNLYPRPENAIIGNTRKEIEANIGKSIVSPLNAKSKELPENSEK